MKTALLKNEEPINPGRAHGLFATTASAETGLGNDDCIVMGADY